MYLAASKSVKFTQRKAAIGLSIPEKTIANKREEKRVTKPGKPPIFPAEEEKHL
jgi:hypothetical protein